MNRACLSLLALGALSIPQLASADPGELTAVGVGERGNDYGYWEYLPNAYVDSEEWPVFVFLGGVGEVGTGEDDGPCSWPPPQPDFDGAAGLCNNLRHGPQSLIWRTLHEGEALWDDGERPFIVISPQNPLVYSPYDPGALFDFLDYLEASYAVDPRRMYLVGMSEGGHTIPTYLMTDPDRLAAVSVLAGFVNDEPMAAACELDGQAIWMFHGEDDLDFHVENLVEFWMNLGTCQDPRAPGRLTVYVGAQHDVWTRTINPAIGMGDATDPAYDPYDVDLYTWLLSFDKPVVDAGPDIVASADDDVIALSATVEDDDAIAWEWTQIEGPPVTLVGADAAMLGITDAVEGTLAFRVRALDVDGQYDEDEVTVTVEAAGAGEAGTTASDDTDAGTDDGHDEHGGMTGAGDDAPSTVGDDDEDDGIGDDEDTDGGDGEADDDADAGCGCHAPSRSTPAAFAWIVLALACRRRGRSRPA